jgi:hypothetical protein
MALIAHGIATGANAGKIAISHGNPLTLNYPQWIFFIKSLLSWMSARMANPVESPLIAQAKANLQILDKGWAALISPDDDFPTLIV